MPVQLRYQITQGAEVDFFAPLQGQQRLGGAIALGEQLLLIGRVKLMQFGDLRPLRHQDQPGKAGVIHQPHLAQIEGTDGVGIGRQTVV